MRSFLLLVLLGFMILMARNIGFAQTPIRLQDPSDEIDGSPYQQQPQQAASILKRLQEWQKDNPSEQTKALRVVYFYPKNRKPIKGHVKRWDEIMTDIQNFYRDEMGRWGYGEVTLALEKEKGMLKLHEVQGAENDDGTYNYHSGKIIYDEVFRALAKQGIDAHQETLLIVCGLSKTEDRKVTIYSPYYGWGGAKHSRGICFTADAEWLMLDGLKPDSREITLQVKEHRGYEPFTFDQFNVTYIGGTIHELGHGLSLPHNYANSHEERLGTALMGAGNYTYRKEWRTDGKGSFLTHAHAIRLVAHPLFSGTMARQHETPKPQYRDLEITFVDNQIHVRGKVDAVIPVIGMVAYNDRKNANAKDYSVNQDYDATTWTSALDQNNAFWLRVGDLKDGAHQLRIVSVHANGATVTKRFHYHAQAGKPDLSQAHKEVVGVVVKEDTAIDR